MTRMRSGIHVASKSELSPQVCLDPSQRRDAHPCLLPSPTLFYRWPPQPSPHWLDPLKSTHSPAPPHALHWVNIRMLEIKKVIKIRQGVNPNAGLKAQTGVQTAPTYPERVSDAFLVHPLLQNWRRAFLFLSLSFAVTKTSSFLF